MTGGTVRSGGLARTNGFAPIESYGVIGDSKSIALVARDGAIDWWAAPAMDSPPVFAAILDSLDGGCFTLEPAVRYRVRRRYLPGTNVLETTFSTRDGAVRVIDSLNGEFVARAGDKALLTLVAADQAPLVVPSAAEVRGRLETSEEAWRRWCETVPYQGDDRELVLRSVLALKLLTYSPTGAMAAAATTSLPERVGGGRNYDYRYGWIRDTSFVLDSFIRLGLTQEVQGTLAWMLSCISATAPEIHPFYALSGHVPDEETELRLRGYRDSSPARGGNRAVGQPQWGCYGDLLECVWLAVDRAGAHLDPSSADLLHTLGNKVCDVWTEPDSGIWELEDRRHNTFSKTGCWVALDRLIRLSERGQVSDRDVDRWTAERAAIPAWVDRHCWSEPRRSYAGHAGSDELDASLLLMARTGFIDGKDPRFAQTIKAIRAELAEGPLLYRFSGAREIEGAFVACSFWLIDALVRSGHPCEARKLWRELTSRVSDLGLLAEEIDPATGAFLGNLPQGLSHLSLLNAAALLDEQRVDDGLEQADDLGTGR
jgi:GH15 family glucan-1,4-alpha-glucosidase